MENYSLRTLHHALQALARSSLATLALTAVSVSSYAGGTLSYATDPPPTTQADVAAYVRDYVLGGSFGEVTLWMTESALDSTCVARDLNPDVPDEPFPLAPSWLVMIDDYPAANFSHPVRWLFVGDDLSWHTTPEEKQFSPTVWANMGAGPQLPFHCAGVTPTACPEMTLAPETNSFTFPVSKDCLYAVLISGGINKDNNRSDFAQNLRSMYQILRKFGWPATNIFVYYADGNTPLDCDNADGDGNDATGNDVAGPADKKLIQGKIVTLKTTCASVLFIYGSNHGYDYIDANFVDHYGLALWDMNKNGKLDYPGELYTPDDFDGDTRWVSGVGRTCRIFALFDQCWSGVFTPIATNGNHPNLAVYTASEAGQETYGCEYMSQWEQMATCFDTMNFRHLIVSNWMAAHGSSTPTSAEGTASIVDFPLGHCCFCVTVGITPQHSVGLSFDTETNRYYYVEYTDTLGPPEPLPWQTLEALPGTGGTVEVDDVIGPMQRFYRIREE